jgi:hypothetical protein
MFIIIAHGGRQQQHPLTDAGMASSVSFAMNRCTLAYSLRKRQCKDAPLMVENDHT